LVCLKNAVVPLPTNKDHASFVMKVLSLAKIGPADICLSQGKCFAGFRKNGLPVEMEYLHFANIWRVVDSKEQKGKITTSLRFEKPDLLIGDSCENGYCKCLGEPISRGLPEAHVIITDPSYYIIKFTEKCYGSDKKEKNLSKGQIGTISHPYCVASVFPDGVLSLLNRKTEKCFDNKQCGATWKGATCSSNLEVEKDAADPLKRITTSAEGEMFSVSFFDKFSEFQNFNKKWPTNSKDLRQIYCFGNSTLYVIKENMYCVPEESTHYIGPTDICANMKGPCICREGANTKECKMGQRCDTGGAKGPQCTEVYSHVECPLRDSCKCLPAIKKTSGNTSSGESKPYDKNDPPYCNVAKGTYEAKPIDDTKIMTYALALEKFLGSTFMQPSKEYSFPPARALNLVEGSPGHKIMV
jgi:hypothetical protein